MIDSLHTGDLDGDVPNGAVRAEIRRMVESIHFERSVIPDCRATANGVPPRVGIIAVRAPVAQWIERRPPEPKVAGSNPVGRAIVMSRDIGDT